MAAVLDRVVTSEYGLSKFVLEFRPFVTMNDEQFYGFCQANRDVRIERDKGGEIIIMPPTGAQTGDENAEITTQLRIWSKRHGGGRSYDSSSGFVLPNGATRSPDASWVRNDRLEKFTRAQLRKFLPLSPDFVVELRSPSDSLTDLQSKMAEYIENGTRLGWLIDSEQNQVHVYRPATVPIILDNPTTVSGEDILPGFELDLYEIWKM